MRKIIASALMTLDGVVEDPGGYSGTAYGGWAQPYFGQESVRLSIEKLATCDYFLCGRRTYEMFAAAWGNADGPYADRLRSLPKLVASSTLTGKLTWNATLLEGDAIAALRQIKKEDGGDIMMYGNPALLRSLLEHGLVDELEIMLHPLVLGTGQMLFAERTELKLVRQKTLQSGVLVLTYEPA
ncbi:dihydrofolate reductase [Kribbella sp. VKM Ac-2569]|uniref:dihydrofolate reductase family protein n=1 Tax=Kribbella sp. VKM Ac-2569 TaxID=2512220 RepID=UPI00102C31FE|nr:dihydrofolate reductase family protein [Kribbella sp. VKM Ac-2569]RZT12785.1 dihydrofolate reductase [Kribbella sp. VKM Ac-2569]